MDPVLSVILPMFNEEAMLTETLSVISAQLESTGEAFELVCVNDGSHDNTAPMLDEAARADARLVVIHLSRNFGKEAAMAAGLDHVRGKAAILLDADLQHPAQLIPLMVSAWKDGADVVNGVKAKRAEEGAVYRLMAAVFNRLMGGAAGADFHGASDFKVLDRQVVDALRACPERHRFFRGLVAWVGFRTVDVPFEVEERRAGESKWSTRDLIRYSLKNLLSFSALPLRAIAAVGFSTLAFAGLMAAWTLFRYLRGDSLAGFPTVILLQLIFGGLLLTSLGVISLYLAELYEEAKSRPIYLYRAVDSERDRPGQAAPRAPKKPSAAADQTVLAMDVPDRG